MRTFSDGISIARPIASSLYERELFFMKNIDFKAAGHLYENLKSGAGPELMADYAQTEAAAAQRIVERISKDEFVGLVNDGEKPTLKLSPAEMESLQGGWTILIDIILHEEPVETGDCTQGYPCGGGHHGPFQPDPGRPLLVDGVARVAEAEDRDDWV
jgi:hypothetical protein